MKIVDVTEFYSERGGGIRSHLRNRGHVLSQLGHDHTVIAPGPRDQGAVAYANVGPNGQGAREGRSRVIRTGGPPLPYDRTYHLLGRFDKIRTEVRRVRPDVLEAHSPYLATLATVACGRHGARIRTAFWHADHLGTYVEPALARVVGPQAAAHATRPLRHAVRALLAPFHATFAAGAEQCRRLCAAGVENVVHVPFGVDVATFHPGARSAGRRSDLARTGAPSGPLLLSVGRLAFEKRVDIVLEAFSRVRTRWRSAQLVIFGDGPERKGLERMAGPGVRFAGFEHDSARLACALASADMLVHGCPYETFGLGVREAVACGLPVVVPDQGGAVESADPRCSQTYRSLDATACARAIEALLDRDPGELRTRAIEASMRVPTVEEHMARVLGTYHELLGAC